MHPAICEYVSSTFYDNRLTNASSVEHKSYSDTRSGIILKDVPEGEHRSTQSGGLVNPNEARAVLQELYQLQKKYPEKTIYVLSFYKQQYLLLESMYMEEKRLASRKHIHKKLSFGTVDSAQGHESDFVLLSVCRTDIINEFLNDPRRLNVAGPAAFSNIGN